MNKNPDHKGNLAALRRIEGQVRGTQKMIEDGKYCVDIITQIQAARGALSTVAEKILEKHLCHCVTNAIKGPSGKEKKKKIDEILKSIHQIR